MNAVLYYSYSGSTRRLAKARAEAEGADLFEIREAKKRSFIGTFLVGAPQGMHRKASTILPLSIDWEKYDCIFLFCPVWAGYPAPAFNAALALIPHGMEVSVVLCSGGGETPASKEGTIELIRQAGLKFGFYEDIRTGAPPKPHA